ncbi:MAG: hypothetical protein M3Z30_12705 [Gemmatimonadota bacterium]|nr:hypothetical protein [Gemmatimonadota bacterium]
MKIPGPSLPPSLTLVTALCAAACSSSTAPDPALRAFVGVYALASVDGTPLPVLQLDYSTTRQYLVADTIRADGIGHFSRTTVTRTDSVGRPYSSFYRESSASAYNVRADTIHFVYTCPPGAACVPPPIGWLSADGGFTLADDFATGYNFISRYYRVP